MSSVYGGDSGYDGSENSGSGYGGSDNTGSGYGGGYPSDSGYQGLGYPTENTNFTDELSSMDEARVFGAGDTSLRTDFVTDSYRENAFEVNNADSAWTETLSDPDPQLYQEQPTFFHAGDFDGDDQLELEP